MECFSRFTEEVKYQFPDVQSPPAGEIFFLEPHVTLLHAVREGKTGRNLLCSTSYLSLHDRSIKLLDTKAQQSLGISSSLFFNLWKSQHEEGPCRWLNVFDTQRVITWDNCLCQVKPGIPGLCILLSSPPFARALRPTVSAYLLTKWTGKSSKNSNESTRIVQTFFFFLCI